MRRAGNLTGGVVVLILTPRAPLLPHPSSPATLHESVARKPLWLDRASFPMGNDKPDLQIRITQSQPITLRKQEMSEL